PDGRHPAVRNRTPVFTLERPGRPARPTHGEPRRGGVRRRGLDRTDGYAEASSPRARGTGPPRGCRGRAQPMAQPGAGDGTADRPTARSPPRPTSTPPHETVEGGERAPSRRKAETKRSQAPPRAAV